MCKVFFIRSRLVALVLILLCGGAVYAQQPATRYLSDDIPKAWTPDTLFRSSCLLRIYGGADLTMLVSTR